VAKLLFGSAKVRQVLQKLVWISSVTVASMVGLGLRTPPFGREAKSSMFVRRTAYRSICSI